MSDDLFDDKLLLSGDTAQKIYDAISKLPIIDYHCHLNEEEIKCDKHLISSSLR